MNKLETYSIRPLLIPEVDVKPGDIVAFIFPPSGCFIKGIVDSVSSAGVCYDSLKLDRNLRNPHASDVSITYGIVKNEFIWGAVFINPLEKSVVAGEAAYSFLSREGLLGQISLDAFYPKKQAK